MGLWTPSLSEWNFRVDNTGVNPSSTGIGTSVIPGVSNAEGSWTETISDTVLTSDCYWMWVRVSDGLLASTVKKHLLDIGVDPAGGTAYSEIIPNILCGSTSTMQAGGGGGHYFSLPFYIKAGSAVAVRIRGSHSVAGTVLVGMQLFGAPSRPEVVFKGAIASTLGITEASTDGTSFTPGNAADGTWVSLGTAPRAARWVQGSYQLAQSTITGEQTYIEYAVGDASNKRIILRSMHAGATSEATSNVLPFENFVNGYHEIPSGAELWVRGRCVNAPDTGYQAGITLISGS